MLISREYGVPAEDDGSDPWSIDHLFIDQDGVPTLVEVKRSSDTRIRREVVGQMFDYAANAVLHWPVATIVHTLEERCAEEGISADDELAAVIGDGDRETFWQQVKTNLEAGRARLVFVADEIPDELRAIVDFLSRQLNPASAFAIEVKQYVGESGTGGKAKPIRSLVSRLVAGWAPNPVAPPAVRWTPGVRWTTERFFDELKSSSPSDLPIARKLAEFGEALTEQPMEGGVGNSRGSLKAHLKAGGLDLGLFSIYTTGDVSINLGWNKRLGELGDHLSERYRAQASEAGFPFDQKKWEGGEPRLKLDVVEQKLNEFERLMTSIAGELRELAKSRRTESQGGAE